MVGNSRLIGITRRFVQPITRVTRVSIECDEFIKTALFQVGGVELDMLVGKPPSLRRVPYR
jgi:hypothetical protein